MSKYNNVLINRKWESDPKKGFRYYNSVLDPDILRSEDDIYVITTYGDRLDLLSFQYYNDTTLWWIIAAANPELRKDSLYLEPGIQLRIPRDYQDVLQLLADQNKER
jgi:phage tail protein X